MDVSNISGRVKSEDKKELKLSFDKLQINNLINKYIFRMEVLGAQVPDVIAERIFSVFATCISVELQQQISSGQVQSSSGTIGNLQGNDVACDGMSFEDLLACYLVFKEQRTEEIAQLVYEMMKLSRDQPTIGRDDLVHFCKRIAQLDDNFVNLFFKRTKLDPRIPITLDEFIEVYPLVQQISLFTLIQDIIGGFKNEYINIDEDSFYGTKSFGLSEIQVEKLKADEVYGLKPEEIQQIRNFFDEEIRGQDAKTVLQLYKHLLKDIEDRDLNETLIESVTKYKGNNFDFFLQLVSFAIKPQEKVKVLELIFEIFAQFKPKMEFFQLVKFCEIFDMAPPINKESKSKQDFLKMYNIENLSFKKFTQSKNVMIAMLGVQNEGTNKEQKQAIESFLVMPLLEVENFIQENLDKEKSFFVVEKEFWDKFCGETCEKSTIIDNQKLIEKGHEFRLRDSMAFNEDFVIVPKHVFNSLSKWYKCNKTIELKVYQYNTSDNLHRIATGHSRLQARKGQMTPLQEDMKMIPGEKSDKTNNNTIQLTESNSTSIKTQTFQKVIGDVQYSLEIYPKIIYFLKIPKDGTKPFQDRIVDSKAVLKDNSIPFKELSISKKATFDQIIKYFTEFYDEPSSKKARLIIDDQLVSGLKLMQTLEEYGLQSGQLIYVEFLESNNTWPTDTYRLKQKNKTEEEATDIGAGKTNGLYNLGNTCYMNSAMQCLVNLRPLHEYYVKDKMYIKQLNLQNHLGHGGDLVLSFANLMQQMWNSNQVVVPKGFKHVLGKLNEQFRGDDQQDSQEYVNFLIDGLHEETNLRKYKPYIANPESDNRDLIELGLESMANGLRRDWSFIYFLFYGQMKSTLECLKCGKESTTFDIFTNIPVSLPEPSQLILNIIVHRLPNKVKYLLQTKKKTKPEDGNLDKYLQQNYIELTNDQPIYICLKVDKNMQIRDIIKKIMSTPEVNIDLEEHQKQLFTDIVLYSKQLGTVRGIFDPLNKFTQYKLITNEIHAQEVLTSRGREYIKLMYQHNPQIESQTDSILSTLSYDHKRELEADDSKKNSIKRSANEVFGKAYIFNNYLAACDKFEQLDRLQRLPEEIYAVAYHRRFIKKSHYFFHPYQPQLLSSPLILILPTKPTGRRIYEEVWSLAHNMLKKESKNLQYDKLWWNQKNWKELMADNKGLRPFVLKTVDRQGYSCSQCNWVQKCSGCIIEPHETNTIKDFLKKCHIAIEWQSNMIEEEYNSTYNEILRHSSNEGFDQNDEEKIISLEKCLQKFHDIEKLEDKSYCSKCKQHEDHQKSFQVFRPPPVLTIQLKRFKRMGTQWRKLQNLVEFPIFNLDLSNFVQDFKFLTSQDIACQYDLAGVINHYGSLTYGHYVSMCKNPYDGQWYKYDDQYRIPITESQIAKESAYILFYVRKDIVSKQLSEIFPSINQIFPGKPIQTKFGDGYILGEKFVDDPSGQKTYFVNIKGETHEILRNDILPDIDQNEIHNDLTKLNIDQQEPEPDQQTVQEDQGFLSKLFCKSNKKKQVQITDQQTETQKLIEQEENPKQIQMNNFYKYKPDEIIEEETKKPKSPPRVPTPQQPLIQADLAEDVSELSKSFINNSQSRSGSIVKKKKKKKRKVAQSPDDMPQEQRTLEEELQKVVESAAVAENE